LEEMTLALVEVERSIKMSPVFQNRPLLAKNVSEGKF